MIVLAETHPSRISHKGMSPLRKLVGIKLSERSSDEYVIYSALIRISSTETDFSSTLNVIYSTEVILWKLTQNSDLIS